MKQVLVPVDFSTNASNALDYARILFANKNCIFFLLHAHIGNSNTSTKLKDNDSNAALDPTKQSKEDLNTLLNQTLENNNNIKHGFEIITKTDSLINAINTVIISKNIDLIVMGTKGAKGAKEIFLGSNAVRVINGVHNCPIILVPQSYKVKAPSLIAFSTNFKRAFNKKELKSLISITLSCNAKINIARIMEEEYLTDTQTENKETLKKLFNDLDYIFCKIDVETSETNALRDFVKQTESDLISLVHHKHNFFQKITEEDVVDKISFNSPVPLLILPELK
ncbi:universal stress protein [Aquimarina muelleri]|uniref:Universal stress protein UspA n=1 Tax=Aquimarina muelleri TaxID=279356 RepID=A0A918N4G7_9FLAO|nr:universal stress protein [Aquimarina muelleri]MCX2764105.1 universal stress protein [Aquimarina muelleri]GGX22683.1 universal stress protein UspA [Aquimarina muelleri]